MRDAQRQRLYDAEQSLRASIDRGSRKGSAAALERRFGSIHEVQGYVDDVMARMCNDRITVVERHPRNRMCSMDRRRRRMNLIMTWGARELVVLHELAHYVTSALVPSHGPHFAQNFLDMVEQHSRGGAELAQPLRDAFTKGKVLYGRAAANEIAVRELRNITNGIRGDGTVCLVYEHTPGTFTPDWRKTAELRQCQVPVDRDALVAIGIRYR